MRLTILLLLCNYVVFAQYCGTATTNVAITPATSVQYSSIYSSGRRAFNFNAVAGNEYTFSTVGETSMDTYLRLYSTGTGGSLLVESDDYYNTQSEITWYCTSSGTYSVLLTRWSSSTTCNTLNANARIKYQMGSTAGSTIVSIGSGEGIVYQVPVNHYYNYGWSEMIYLKSEINTVGSITKIRFQVEPSLPSPPYVAENQKIYMAHTTYSTLPNVVVKEDAQTNYASSNYMLVYDGTINWNIGWVEIVLQAPFPWNNTDNLLIKYENREGSFSANYPMFYYTAKTATVGYKYQDASYPTSDGTRDGFRPNLKLAISDIPLPVGLISFDGYKSNDKNVLRWSTASESNNDYFMLERSQDGNIWDHVSNIDAVGNSIEVNKYVYFDDRFSGYYRLTQYDVDGKNVILGTIALIDDKTKYIVKVYDLSGREVGFDYHGVVVVVYSDGSIVKNFW